MSNNKVFAIGSRAHHDITGCSEITVEAVTAEKDGKQYCFGVVSPISNNTGSSPDVSALAKQGCTGFFTPHGVPYRKAVQINLPAGVHYGLYAPVQNSSKLVGFYADCAARDGNGRMVYVFSNPQQGDTTVQRVAFDSDVFMPVHDYNTAIDRTIAAGLFMSVPQLDGTRKTVPVTVQAVTALYNDRHPGYNK